MRIITKGLGALIVGFLLLLTLPTNTFAYEEDTHFLITYVTCRSVGFTDDEALTVAAVNQGMDDSIEVNAHDRGVPHVEEQWRWHALDKDGKMSAKGIIERRDSLFESALKEKDPKNRLIKLGVFFHYQQDSWAHRHHNKDNRHSRNAFTTFNTPTGHARRGSNPDRPPLDPVAALMSLQDGIGFARRFLKENLEREPNVFLAESVGGPGKIDNKWRDKRKGKFFNQIYLLDEKRGSPGSYIKSLLRGQIEAYERSRDPNPFYFPKRTPDKVDFEKVRKNLQDVVAAFKGSSGTFQIPGQEEKLAKGFTEMTTQWLLTLYKEERVPLSDKAKAITVIPLF